MRRRSSARWRILKVQQPKAFAADANLPQIAGALVGVTVAALESLVKVRDHSGQALGAADLTRIKKDLVERDSAGLVEFIESQAHARRLSRPGGAEAAGCARTSRCGRPAI